MGQMKWMAMMGASDLAGVDGGAVSRSPGEQPVWRSPPRQGHGAAGCSWRPGSSPRAACQPRREGSAMYGPVTGKETPCRAREGSAIHGAGRAGAGRGRGGGGERGTEALPPPGATEPAPRPRDWDAGPRGSCAPTVPGRLAPGSARTLLRDAWPGGCSSRLGIPAWSRAFCNPERSALSDAGEARLSAGTALGGHPVVVSRESP